MSRRVAALFVFAAAAWSLSGCGALSARPEGFEQRDFKVDPAIRFKAMSLGEVAHRPQVGLAVEFIGLLNRVDENYFQPLYTGFKPEDYRNFSAFLPEAAVWDAQGRSKGSVSTLFIHRDSPSLAMLVASDRYTPLKVRGRIIDDAQGRPWIEVLDINAAGKPWFTDDSLALLINGLAAIKDKPADSVKHLNRALQAPLSPAGRSTAYVALATIAHGLKDYTGAESYYKKAMEIDPGNEDAREGVYRARNRMEPRPIGSTPSTGPTPATGPTSASGDAAALAAQLAKANAEIEQLRGQWEKDKADWTRSLTAETEARRAAEAKSADHEGRFKALEMERDDLKKKLETAGGDAAKLADAEARLKAAEMERDDLKRKLETAGGDAAKVAELEGKVKTLETACAEHESKLKAAEMERDELKKKLEGAGGDAAKVAELEGKVKTLETACAEHESKLKAAEMERDELKKRLEGAGGDAAKVTELEGKVKALETERDEAKTKLTAAETERDELKKKLEEGGTGDAEALKKQIEEKDGQIKALNEKVAQVEKDAAAAAEAKVKAEYEARVAELEQKIKDRDDVIKSLRDEVDRLTEELKKKGE